MHKLFLNQDLTNQIVELCQSRGIKAYTIIFEKIVKQGLEIERSSVEPKPEETAISKIVDNGIDCPKCGCNKFIEIDENLIECLACGVPCDKIELEENKLLITEPLKVDSIPSDGFINKKTIKKPIKKTPKKAGTKGLTKQLLK